MARSVLLTGVDAPVGGKPFPVLLALKEAFASPNSYQVPLKGCFALGKAEGNASSERADIQIVRMSCVLPDGKAFEQEITGYLVGEDGKQGIPGKLVDKEGQKDRLCRCRRRRRRTCASIRPAAGDQCGDGFGCGYFNRHRRCSYLRFGEWRAGRRDRDAALFSEAG